MCDILVIRPLFFLNKTYAVGTQKNSFKEAIYSKMKFFQIFFPGISSECQTIWIQIRFEILPGMFWVQTGL